MPSESGLEVFIKVCGIRTTDCLDAALKAGATAVGLNFVASSRRAISVEQAQTLRAHAAAQLRDASVRWVGVFADETADRIAEIRRAVGLDLVQLHGHESPAFCRLAAPSVKALRVGGEPDLARLSDFPGPFVLIDARVAGQLGGTGRQIPLDLVTRATRIAKVVVAGGLTAQNVADVIRTTGPFGVDTASGTEDDQGRPSADRTRAFVEAAIAGFRRLAQETL